MLSKKIDNMSKQYKSPEGRRYILADRSMDFNEAIEFCKANDGYLPKIESEDEFEWITSNIIGNSWFDSFWLGVIPIEVNETPTRHLDGSKIKNFIFELEDHRSVSMDGRYGLEVWRKDGKCFYSKRKIEILFESRVICQLPKEEIVHQKDEAISLIATQLAIDDEDLATNTIEKTANKSLTNSSIESQARQAMVESQNIDNINLKLEKYSEELLKLKEQLKKVFIESNSNINKTHNSIISNLASRLSDLESKIGSNFEEVKTMLSANKVQNELIVANIQSTSASLSVTSKDLESKLLQSMEKLLEEKLRTYQTENVKLKETIEKLEERVQCMEKCRKS